jgi:acyl-coenzyme A thioesterase PaaI-like protein
MICRATVLRSGRTLVFVEAEIVVEREQTTTIVAKALSTLAVIPRRSSTNLNESGLFTE